MNENVELEVTVRAAPERVFRALVEPGELERWFAEHADLAVDEGRFDFWGRFTPEAPDRDRGRHALDAFEEDRLLAFSWDVGGRRTAVSFRLEPAGAATRVTLLHEGVPGWGVGAYSLKDFWIACLENLRGYLERGEVGLRPDFSVPSEAPVKLSLEIDAGAGAVFAGLIEPHSLTRYFPDRADVERKVGGTVDFHWDDVGPQQILTLDPDRELAYSWQTHENTETVVHWELEGTGGRTRLTLVHSGFDREVPDYWIGWIAVMNALKSMVESGRGWERVAELASDVC